jgi:hypothetical protein
MWLENKDEFQPIYQLALDCSATDSGRLPTSLQRLTFNDVDLCSDAFAELLQHLLAWSGDALCSLVVLRPDPVYYFHHFFNRYPVVEVEKGMGAEEFIAKLNQGPPDSPADALGINYSEYVVVPPSMRWFIHALRSAEDDGGHLWVPAGWLNKVSAVYPYTSARQPV